VVHLGRVVDHCRAADATAVGIEYPRGSIAGGLWYGLERYDFPPVGAGRRLEQVSTLTVHLTVQLRSRRSLAGRLDLPVGL
jgi:hypothetical protein